MAGRFLKVLLVIFGVLVLGILRGDGNTAYAAPARKISGITISPAFQQIIVTKDQSEKTFDFEITNNTSEPYELSLSTVDFGSLDESGGVLFLGKADKALNYKYGLSQYVTLQQDRVVVEPKATAKVPVTITNKESLTPGGHYGAVLVSPIQIGNRPTKVQVNQVISSLLFITKQGGEVYKLGLQSYELKTHLFSAPSSMDVRFQNAGNVHVIPRGMITITDPRGRIVKRGYLNEGSAIVLPETFRRLNVPLKTINTAWWPGLYHMTLTYHFDGQDTDQTKELTFTYVNGWYVVSMILLLALGILAIISRPVRRFCKDAGRVIVWPLRKLLRRIKHR